MQSAPSVNHPVGRSRFETGLFAAAWASGLLALLLWLVEGPAPGWPQGLAAFLLLACGCFAWRAVGRSPRGQIGWDGASWRWEALGGSQPRPVQVEVVMDFQSVLLLRLEDPQGGARAIAWLWLEKDADTLSWQALRRALYFRAGQQAQPKAAPAQQ